MEISYGNGSVGVFHLPKGSFSLIIKYSGNVYLRHEHKELKVFNGKAVMKTNIKTNHSLDHSKNTIRIRFNNNIQDELNLFNYIGYFKITDVSIPKKEEPISINFNGLNTISKMETPFNKNDVAINKINSSYVHGRIIRKRV